MGSDTSVPYETRQGELFRSFDTSRMNKQSYLETDQARMPTVVLGNSPIIKYDGKKRKEIIQALRNTLPTQSNNQAAGIPRTLKSTKSIFVQSGEGKTIRITILISEEQNLTCGWLVSETIRHFSKIGVSTIPQANTPLVSLQTVDGIITLDYWLSDLERSVSVLQDGIMLKPFYGNLKYRVTNQKISLKYFHILKLIGTGGFSKVYLGKK